MTHVGTPALDIEVELERVVDALAQHGVPYALCGGLALAVHGHPRATKDIDLLIQEVDVEPGLRALSAAGYRLRAGPIPLGGGTPHPQRLFRATKVAGGAHLTVDLLVVSPSYEEAWASRTSVSWKGRPLWIVTRTGLVPMKSISKRLKDLADIETLQQGSHGDRE